LLRLVFLEKKRKKVSDPSARVWAFGLDRSTIGFWERRMVIETEVHRWDAAEAVDDARDLTTRVALAGLQEFRRNVAPTARERLDPRSRRDESRQVVAARNG
jgi:hypothetical protein